MKSAWDKIFVSDASLTEEEREQAFRELVAAVDVVNKVQKSPAHERIKQRIEAKLTQSPSTP